MLQVHLIFPIVYIIATVFITIVPMIASPVETGLPFSRFLSNI
jgi:L-type amino acid transporter 8